MLMVISSPWRSTRAERASLRSRQMLLSTLAGALTFFGVYYIGGDGFSNTRLWIAFNAYLLMRGGVLAVLFPKQIKRLTDITTTE